ncbi:hypothetical protein TWF694_002079 [Orbilia ellipsospora]|uniref:Uncharacterized protein n=1 Tax=Orbilia ellipsospora TaxID=2528407 RepID=A0AAV9X5L6_9PEZI
MRFSNFSIALAGGILSLASVVTADCAKNNCLRAVIASAFPTRHGSADCSAFMVTTVTPTTQTITVTTVASTVDTLPTTFLPVRRRDINQNIRRIVTTTAASTAGGIPAYASPCDSSARYSSACSCIGVTMSTITLPTPSTTLTVSTTTTRIPNLQATGYVNSICAAAGTSVMFTMSNGECISNPVFYSVNIGSLMPAGCDASKCQILGWGGANDANQLCTGAAVHTNSASGCYDTGVIWSYKLVCQPDACS